MKTCCPKYTIYMVLHSLMLMDPLEAPPQIFDMNQEEGKKRKERRGRRNEEGEKEKEGARMM